VSTPLCIDPSDFPSRVASLAPLSKCLNLRLLDLSRDRYAFTLANLLDAIVDLEDLDSLSLPQSILSDYTDQARRGWPKLMQWPKSLRRLSAPGEIPSRPQSWDVLLESWPGSLTTLLLPDSDAGQQSAGAFLWVNKCTKAATSLKYLEVDESGRSGSGYVPGTMWHILHIFPSLKEITLPKQLALQTVFSSQYQLKRYPSRWTNLRTLILKPLAPPGSAQGPSAGLEEELLALLALTPKLCRLEMHGAFSGGDYEEELKAKLSSTLLERADAPQRSSAGFFHF
jgi:hypothetical protein